MAELEAQINYEFDMVRAAFKASRSGASSRRSRLTALSALTQVNSWRYQYVKRGVDVLFSSILLAVFFIPGILIAAAIALTSAGPIFYREKRIGKGGRSFRIWKFRSMCQKSEWKEVAHAGITSGQLLRWRIHKSSGDPRITAVGGFLRSWSLDELPQILNVLLGEMSLVGPRPVVEAELPLYGELEQYYLAASPGLSGLWQVSGRSNLNFESRAKLDASYVQNWSLLADAKILLRTFPAVLNRVGAH
jgi:lipopolysaccharide/colanic/teichoic acid biosynthesis glycosyltransferase